MANFFPKYEPQNYPVIVCIVFSILYLIFTNYSFPVGIDESEYASIGKSFAQGKGLLQFDKPTTLIVTVPMLISYIWGSGLEYETSLFLSRILFTLISVINLFLITNFLLNVKINNKKLSVNRIVLIQLLTFGNFAYWASKSTFLTEPIAILVLFSIIHILNEHENSNRKLILVGILASLLILTKYVTIVIIPVFFIYFLKKYGFTSKFYKAILAVMVPLILILAPFFFRVYIIETSGENLVISNFSRFSSSDDPLVNIISLANTGLTNHLYGFIEIYSTFFGLKNIILSMLFFIPILIFLFNRIKSREIFEFYILFPVLYIAGLIFSGTGFDRYWLLVFPLLNLFLVYQVSEWKFFRRKFHLPALFKSRLFKIFTSAFCVFFLLSLVYLTFQNTNIFQYKWYLFLYCLIFSLVLVIYLLSGVKYFYLYSLIFLLVVSLNFSRSVNVFIMLSKSLPERAVWESEDEILVSDFLRDKNNVEVYSDGFLGNWASLMTNNFVRHSKYNYDDEKFLKNVYYIERNRGQDSPISFDRKFIKSNLVLSTRTFLVFEIILNN